MDNITAKKKRPPPLSSPPSATTITTTHHGSNGRSSSSGNAQNKKVSNRHDHEERNNDNNGYSTRPPRRRRRRRSPHYDDEDIDRRALEYEPMDDHIIDIGGYSNVTGIQPKKGMRVELRDSVFIWYSATVVLVKSHPNPTPSAQYLTTLRYDGWSAEWNETLPWPHPRIARLFTYTKQVKCLVDLLSRKRASPSQRSYPTASHSSKSNNGKTSTKSPTSSSSSSLSSLWPCKVQFRTPHPGSKKAEDLLRQQVDVYVEPFGASLLMGVNGAGVSNSSSSSSGKSVVGRWLHHSRLRPWRYNASKGHYPPGFHAAWEMGVVDDVVRGTLPAKPFDGGVLLKSRYRLHMPVDGMTCDGGEGDDDLLLHALAEVADECVGGSQVMSSSLSQGTMPTSLDRSDQQPCYQPPPLYPPPVTITEPIYWEFGIRRLEKTKKWTASVSMGGNDIFLSSFSSQSQAHAAKKRLQEGQDSDNNDNNNPIQYTRDDDARLVPLHASIGVVEEKWDPGNNFSLHDWTLKQIRHRGYLIEMRERTATQCDQGKKIEDKAMNNHELQQCAAASAATTTANERCEDGATKVILTRKNKRKMSCPRHVDLENSCYC